MSEQEGEEPKGRWPVIALENKRKKHPTVIYNHGAEVSLMRGRAVSRRSVASADSNAACVGLMWREPSKRLLSACLEEPSEPVRQ